MKKLALLILIVSGLILLCGCYAKYSRNNFSTYESRLDYFGWEFSIGKFEADYNSVRGEYCYEFGFNISHELDRYYKHSLPLSYEFTIDTSSVELGELDVIIDTIRFRSEDNKFVFDAIAPDSGWRYSRYGYSSLCKYLSIDSLPIPSDIEVIYMSTMARFIRLPERTVIYEAPIRYKFLRVREEYMMINLSD